MASRATWSSSTKSMRPMSKPSHLGDNRLSQNLRPVPPTETLILRRVFETIRHAYSRVRRTAYRPSTVVLDVRNGHPYSRFEPDDCLLCDQKSRVTRMRTTTLCAVRARQAGHAPAKVLAARHLGG